METFSSFNQKVMLGGKILVGSIMTCVVFLLFINVTLRYVFNYAIPWAEEVTRYTLLWTVFVGAGVISREGSHISMEAFFNMWPRTLQRVGFLAITALSIATIAVIFYLGLGIVKMVVETGQTSAAAYIPMWLIYGAIPVGSALMILGFVETAWRYWAGKLISEADISLG